MTSEYDRYDQENLNYAPGYDDHDPVETPVDPYAVEPVILPSGVKVEFRSVASLSSNEVRWLRGGVKDAEGQMAFYNELTARLIHLLVESWTLTTVNGEPVLAPRHCRPGTQRAYLQVLPGIDLTRLERHLRPALDLLLGEDEKDAEGE